MRKNEYIGCLVVLVLMYAWALPGCGRQGGVFYETARDAEGEARANADGSEAGAGDRAGKEPAGGSMGGIPGDQAHGCSAAPPGDSAFGSADGSLPEAEADTGAFTENDTNVGSVETAAAPPIRSIYVHICGAVRYPGVYEVSEGSRLYEVIVLAGGLCADACDYLVNQAQGVTDGMQIYIPTMAEAQTIADGTQIPVVRGQAAAEEQTLEQGGSTAGNARTGQQESGGGDTRIDLNSATKEQLMTLPGVGETRAEAIIAYREAHGGFRVTEELMEVSGIKQGVYDRLKEMIKV